MYPKAKIDIGKIPELIKKYPNSLKFCAQANPYFTYQLPKPPKGKADTIAILENLKKLLMDFKSLL
jgi:transcription-repair coupling factor (superfamily II helicase)